MLDDPKRRTPDGALMASTPQEFGPTEFGQNRVAFGRADRNNDGRIQLAEYVSVHQNQPGGDVAVRFDELDRGGAAPIAFEAVLHRHGLRDVEVEVTASLLCGRDGSPVQYVTPDVIIRKVRGQWAVILNPVIAPRVRLNHVYAEMFARHRCAQNTEMAAHLQEARWTVRNIEQRFATILSVSQAIVKRQKHFFEYGALAMKPLGLREIADEVGLHESTVSRVTNNKYMATPLGVFELKYFFSRAMTTASGGACSATAIRGLIKDMIEAERSSAPLSDAEIARQLAQQGLVVARRTVTKYRQLLKIEAVERRRVHS